MRSGVGVVMGASVGHRLPHPRNMVSMACVAGARPGGGGGAHRVGADREIAARPTRKAWAGVCVSSSARKPWHRKRERPCCAWAWNPGLKSGALGVVLAGEDAGRQLLAKRVCRSVRL